MPYHEWGDAWFQKHGDELNEGIDFCLINWERWGRLNSHGKEKYGTFRHNMVWYSSEWPIYSLIYPSDVYYRWPRYLIAWEYRLGYVVRAVGLRWLIRKWQWLVYNVVLNIAINEYPNVKEELLDDREEQDFN